MGCDKAKILNFLSLPVDVDVPASNQALSASAQYWAIERISAEGGWKETRFEGVESAESLLLKISSRSQKSFHF